MLIGYIRISTHDQNHDLQRDALEAIGVERIFSDTASGAKKDRPGLADCLSHLRKGDTLCVWRLDRLGRNTKQLIQTVEDLRAKGVNFRSTTEGFDTTDANGRLVFQIFSALAEFERALISERTKAGLAAARRRGKKPGRKAAMSKHDITQAKALLADSDLTVREIAAQFGISTSTLYSYLPKGRSALAAQNS